MRDGTETSGQDSVSDQEEAQLMSKNSTGERVSFIIYSKGIRRDNWLGESEKGRKAV